VHEVLGNAARVEDLGEQFDTELYACEVDYLVERERAVTADDVLWRRTKSGLQLAPARREALARYLGRRIS